jgi:mannose-6-phosphate isomerase-like protein (cupin superfamily)
LHYHQFAQQFFFILSGTATFIVNGKFFTILPESGRHILPGQLHQIINQTNTDLLFTVTSQPTSRGDRVEVD